MIKEIISQWESNKGKLKEFLESQVTPQGTYVTSYLYIVKAIFTHVIDGYDVERITETDPDDGYSGYFIYIIPSKSNNGLILRVSYGSCEICDTMQYINNIDNNEERVRLYMLLALHIVQRLSWLDDIEAVNYYPWGENV